MFGGSATPIQLSPQGRTKAKYLRPLGAVHFLLRTLNPYQCLHVEIRRLPEGDVHLNDK